MSIFRLGSGFSPFGSFVFFGFSFSSKPFSLSISGGCQTSSGCGYNWVSSVSNTSALGSTAEVPETSFVFSNLGDYDQIYSPKSSVKGVHFESILLYRNLKTRNFNASSDLLSSSTRVLISSALEVRVSFVMAGVGVDGATSTGDFDFWASANALLLINSYLNLSVDPRF